MIRTLFRLVIVLLVGASVAVGLYAFSTTSLAQSLVPERGERPPMEYVDEDKDECEWGTGATVKWHGTEGYRPGPDHTEEGLSLLRALPGMGEHLVVIGLVTAAIVLIRRGMRMLKPRRGLQCGA